MDKLKYALIGSFLSLMMAGCSDDDPVPAADAGAKDAAALDAGPAPDSGGDAAVDLAGDASSSSGDASSSKDTSSGADAGAPPASGTFSSAGGSISVALTGLVTRIQLDLPAGTLAASEKATMTLNARASLPADHPTMGGADHAGGFSLDVSPASLRKKVELALRLRVTLSNKLLPAAARKSMYKDPMAWAEAHLLASFRGAAVQDTAAPVTLCKYTPKIKHTPLRIDWNLFEKKIRNTGTELAYSVELAGPFPLVFERYGLGEAYRTSGLKGEAFRLWRTIIPMHAPFEMKPHKHIGPVVFRYFPISVGPPKSGKYYPNKPWPIIPSDAARVQNCLGTLVSAALDPLAARKYDTLRWPYPAGYSQWHTVLNKKYGIKGNYGGKYLPYVVFIYDYSTSPDVAATSNMWLRTMRLPTAVVAPKLYSAKNCFTPQAKSLVATVGHEVFHWQQGAYVMPQIPGKLDPGYFSLFHQNKTKKHGPYDLSSEMKYYIHEWIYEGTARYFDSVYVRNQGYWTRRGLASFPLDRPPWRLTGGKLWAALHGPNSYWAYYRSFFFKFLLDQEAGGATDELTGLKLLLQALQKEQKAKGASARYLPVVKKWMEAPPRNLTWFRWMRELLLLRGCSIKSGKDGCPDIPKTLANPFGTKAAAAKDVYGQTEQADHWASFIPTGGKRWHMKLKPYDKLPPGFDAKQWKAGGRVLEKSAVCNFDTNEPAYQMTGLKDGAGKPVPDSTTILNTGPVTITLPLNVQFRLSGARLDIRDTLPATKTVSKYQWTVTMGKECAFDLELEAHESEQLFTILGKTDSLKFLKRTAATSMTFVVTPPKAGDATGRLAWVHLLSGNTAWSKDAPNPKKACTLQVSIKGLK